MCHSPSMLVCFRPNDSRSLWRARSAKPRTGTLAFARTTFRKKRGDWRKISSRSTVHLNGTTAIHILYQHAFQHFVPDFVTLLPVYWDPEILNATKPRRALFLTQEICPLCDETYPSSLFEHAVNHWNSTTHCKLSRECSVVVRYPFVTLSEAIHKRFDTEFWCYEKTCRKSKDNRHNYACFDEVVLSLNDDIQWSFGRIDRNELAKRTMGQRSTLGWFFDKQDSQRLVEKTIGKRSEKERICFGQRSGHSRVIRNLAEVRSFLQERFAQVVDVISFEDMSFEAQLALIDTCKVLVAPHGGAMTNAAFIKQGSKVVEIFPAHFQHIYYYESAVKSAGASYAPLIASVQRVEVDSSCEKYKLWTLEKCQDSPICQDCFKQGNMTVDIGVLSSLLTGLGA